MTALLRTAYRTFVPEPVRRFRWGLKNAFGGVFKDATPRSVRFDYDSYWATKEQEDALWLSYRELIALCEARIEPGASVLDVGCGNGILLRHLKRTKGIRELGIDVSTRAVRLCQESGVRAEVLDITRGDIPRIGLVDVATVFEVLEHIPNPEAVLLSLQSVATRILVSVPNTGYYIHRLRLMCGRFPRQWIQHPAEHLRFWTLRDFQNMAQKLGLVVEEVIPIRGQDLLAKVAPSWFAESLFFALRTGGSVRATRSADDERLAVSQVAALEVRKKLDATAVPTRIAGKQP